MKPLTIAVVWTLSFCSMAIIIGLVIDAPHLLLLEYKHAETNGEVTRTFPEEHGQVEVEYIVAGKTYRDAFAPHLHMRIFAKGDSIRVYYSPKDPTTAFIAPPGEILAEQMPAWIAGSLLMSTGVIAAVLIFWSPAAPFHRFSRLVSSPKVLSAAVTMGVAGGLLLSFF